MINVSSCLIALLLSSTVFAAPAVAPVASSAAVVSSPAVSSSPAVASTLVASSAATVSSAISSAAPPAGSQVATPSADSKSKSTASTSFPAASATVAPISLNLNGVLWNSSDSGPDPQAIRGSLGATIIGPTDDFITKENPDLLAPPSTDHGSVQNAKWPFSMSHNRLQTGGWARQQNQDVMPIAANMAGVNMRLEAGAIRELHWHSTAEWAYVIKGSTQITAVDASGRNFISTVGPGDLWYFPPGVPHSLQATDDDPDGSEFLLVFNSGAFSEDDTFLLTDWLAHVPVDILEKNFQTSASAFAHIPSQELYIFPSTPPADGNSTLPASPAGVIPNPFSFPLSQMQATNLNGGSVKIVDSRSFAAATAISAAEVTVEPGAIRELHWHPTQDEWSFYIEGEARVTIFAAQSNSRTFNYVAGDVGYIPATMGHYVENTGNTTLRFLEIFNSDIFEDISLSTWLALTPPELVKAHLGFDDETLSHLFKSPPTVIGPA